MVKQNHFRALKNKLINELNKEKEILKQEKEIKELKQFIFRFIILKPRPKANLRKILYSTAGSKIFDNNKKTFIYIIRRFIRRIIRDEKIFKKFMERKKIKVEANKETENKKETKKPQPIEIENEEDDSNNCFDINFPGDTKNIEELKKTTTTIGGNYNDLERFKSSGCGKNFA